MDGKGCWRDNVFVERLWKSVKYEEVYLKAYDSVTAAKAGLGTYLRFYNTRRPHQALDGESPDAVYFENLPQASIAADGPGYPQGPLPSLLRAVENPMDNPSSQGSTYQTGDPVQTTGTTSHAVCCQVTWPTLRPAISRHWSSSPLEARSAGP
jgi:putative transposase